MTIVRLNEFKSAEGKAGALHQFLISLVPYISNSEGCISCEVLTQQDNTSTFIVIEKWESIECHLKSIEGFPKEKMTAAMSLIDAPPAGRYFND